MILMLSFFGVTSQALPELDQAEVIRRKLAELSQPSRPASDGCAVCGNTTGSLKQCSGCGKVRYCSQEHQKQHWKTHKRVCKHNIKKN
jgi:hypothetical protein